MFKRILVIFLISLGSLVGVVGVSLGIKYLTGEFNEKIVAPEDIYFEQNDYYFDGNKETYTITITTTTEGANQKDVSLYFERASQETRDKTHWTDGNIIIPKIVSLGTPFDVQIVKDKSHTELGNIDWVHGGISTIIASSENKLINPTTARVLVDVPVYSTELVVYNKEISTENLTFESLSKNIEYSQLATPLANNEHVDVRAGDTFYVGVKFYPYASAFKYSQLNSTNLLNEYKNQIANSLGVDQANVYADLDVLFTENTNLTAKNIFTAYENFISENANIASAVSRLETTFKNGLKYNKITEKMVDDNPHVEILNKIAGTNIYKIRATTNLDNVDFYTYVFKNSSKEDQTLSLISSTGNELNVLEDSFVAGNALRTVSGVNIIEVEVDTILVRGTLQNIYPDRLHTIYATKSGINSRDESYLNILLSNSNIDNIDLQDKASNLGIRFQKRSGVNWVDASTDEISFRGNYQTMTDSDGKVYYLPIGDVPTWVIYANNYISNDFRLSMKYFIDDSDYITVSEDKLPRINLIEITTRTENTISWKDTSNIELQVVSLEGVSGSASSVVINPEFDLESITDFDTVNSNVYTTVKYFIYTDDTAFNADTTNTLSVYFDTKETTPLTYTFLSDGSVKNLYELNSHILRLKNIDIIPSVPIKVVYATIKTNALGAPVYTEDNLYEIVKYSAIKESSVERLTGVEIVCKKSLKTLTGTFSIKDNDNAAMFEDESLIKVAQNCQAVLKIEVESDGATDAQLKEAYLDGQITVVAATGNMMIDNNDRYIVVDGDTSREGKLLFEIGTKGVAIDETIKLYISYTIGDKSYQFPIYYVSSPVDNVISNILIVSNTKATGGFAFTEPVGDWEEFNTNNIDKITVSTTYENNSFVTKYRYVLKEYPEGEEGPINISSDFLFNEGEIKVTIINFLNRNVTDTYNWEIRSSNILVATVSENKHSITFNKTGESLISLYVDGEIQDQVLIEVENSGYVSKYIINDDNRNNYAYEFSPTNAYVNRKESLTITRGANQTVYLGNRESEYTNIFEMYYTLIDKVIEEGVETEVSREVKLNFTIRIADAESLARYMAITGEEDVTLQTEIGFIKLARSLGDGVTINLAYTNEDLQLVQNITLYFRPTIERKDLVITNKYDDEVVLPKNEKYELYAQTEYLFEQELVEGAQNYIAYYYMQNDDGEFVAREDIFNAGEAGQNGIIFKYPAVSKDTTIKIYISNNADGIAIGDLQYSFEAVIKPNVRIKEVILNNGYEVVLQTNGTQAIDVASTFVERIIGETEFGNGFAIKSIILSNVTATPSSVIECNDGTNINLSFSGNAKITQYCQISFMLSYEGYDAGTISLKIYPYDYEKPNADRLAYYKNEKAIVLVVGDEVAVKTNGYLQIDTQKYTITKIDEQFEEGSVIYLNDFGAYTRGGVDNKTVWAQSNNLITETNLYVEVLDERANTTKYRVIISQMDVPLIKLNEGVNTKSIDIYKLLIGYSGVDLANYYKTLGINLGNEQYYGGDTIELFDNLYTFQTPNETDASRWSVRANLVDMPGESLSNYVTISQTDFTLAVKQVGFDFAIQVNLDYRNGNYIYTIPSIVNIHQSQRLVVNYPYSNEQLPEDYGTENYDQGMIAPTIAFANIAMEYGEFDINGNALFDFSNGQFIVEKLNNDTYVVDEDYNSVFLIEVAQASVNLNGSWSFISSTNYSNFVTINEIAQTVTVKKNGAIGVRVKLLVKTKEGSAVNYYYLQAGEIPEIVLLKKSGEALATDRGVAVNYDDEIYLLEGSVITFENGAVSANNYNYYLSDNNDKLFYKVLLDNKELTDGEIATYFTQNLDSRTLTVCLVPNGETLKIVAYTIYGPIQTITVIVYPYYQSVIKQENIGGYISNVEVYSGAKYNVSEFVTITKYGTGEEVNGFELQEFTPQENEQYYKVQTISDTLKVVFAHSKTTYTIPKFICNVEIEGKIFTIVINNLEVLPSIITKSVNGRAIVVKDNYGEVGETDKFNAASGTISIPANVWQQLFNIKNVPLYGLSYSYSYNGVEYPANANDIINVNIGSIVANQTINITFKIICEFNDQTIEISTVGSVNVVPEFTVTTNYPQPNDNTSYAVEYVQIGATVDFSGKNFNDKSRLAVERTSNGSLVSDFGLDLYSDGTLIDSDFGKSYTFEYIGTYEVRVKIDNIVYGVYNVIVDNSNPFGINTSKIDGKVFYAGYGSDIPINYVDIVFNLPSSMPYISTGETFNICADTLVNPMLENIYYRTADVNKKFKVAIPISDYITGVNTQNIYVEHNYIDAQTGEEKTFSAPCTNVVISTRYSLTYNGQAISVLFYNNVINGVNFNKISEDNNLYRYEYSLEYRVDNVAEASKAITGTGYEYYVAVDIVVDDAIIELNANEYPDGLSLVELLNIKDNNGKSFWYNHVGTMGMLSANSATISLSYVTSTMATKERSIRIEQRTFGTGANINIYDYYIKALGATNDGTTVTLKLEYSVESFKYSKEINIKVYSDINYSLLNNDGTNTPNSSINPFTLTGVATLTLAIANQNDENNQRYFVYAWGEYDSSATNIAQSLNVTVSGDWISGDITSIVNGNLVLDINTYPTFGDKSVVVTFEDAFGFTFTYYISLIATTRVETVRNNQEKVYEGDTILISNNTTTGVMVTLSNNETFEVKEITSIKATSTISGQQVELVNGINSEEYLNSDNEAYYIATLSGKNLIFNEAPQKFWTDYGNGSSVNLTIKLSLTRTALSDETSIITINFVLTRRYEYEVKQENTYVRDGVEFELANIVSVYDNKNGYYLGEPTLTDTEALKVSFNLKDASAGSGVVFSFRYGDTTDEYVITSDISVVALMQALEAYIKNPSSEDLKNNLTVVKKRVNNDNEDLDDDATFLRALAEEILSGFGITIVTNSEDTTKVDGFLVSLIVKAINKYTNNDVSVIQTFMVSYNDTLQKYTTISGNELNFVVIGEEASFKEFEDINFLNYNFELHQNENIFNSNIVKVAPQMVSNGYCFIDEGATIEQTEIKILKVAVNVPSESDGINVLLKLTKQNGTKVIKYETLKTSEQFSILLCADEYTESENIELFTGYYSKSGSTYTIEDEQTNSQAYNGLALQDVKDSKNISLVYVINNGVKQQNQTVYLDADGRFTTDTVRNVDYQTRYDINLGVEYLGSKHSYTSTEAFRITLKYIGVDTSKAYTGTYLMKKVNINNEDNLISNTGSDDDPVYILNSTAEVSLEDWSSNFSLIPGVGKIAELAINGAEDLTIVTNSDEETGVLRFALKAVTDGSGNSSTESSHVRINNQTGQIQLIAGFNLSEYYISIEISCMYPNSEDGLTEYRPIGVVFIGFNAIYDYVAP